MKMDISYTDHSYIIGRGGNNIKKIMEDTLTHIHFPDSNRSNPLEKSNQVSLCGSMEGVERARALVRVDNLLFLVRFFLNFNQFFTYAALNTIDYLIRVTNHLSWSSNARW